MWYEIFVDFFRSVETSLRIQESPWFVLQNPLWWDSDIQFYNMEIVTRFYAASSHRRILWTSRSSLACLLIHWVIAYSARVWLYSESFDSLIYLGLAQHWVSIQLQKNYVLENWIQDAWQPQVSLCAGSWSAAISICRFLRNVINKSFTKDDNLSTLIHIVLIWFSTVSLARIQRPKPSLKCFQLRIKRQQFNAM